MMKNSPIYMATLVLLFLIVSCQKDLTGNAISVEARSNVTVDKFHLYSTCRDGPNQLPLGNFDPLNASGNGYYTYSISAGYETECFTVTGNIPANNDSTGTTQVEIEAFYTEEGNVVGFQEIEFKRPHDEYKIRYEFRPDTYLEE